jgi:hypothetical protein
MRKKIEKNHQQSVAVYLEEVLAKMMTINLLLQVVIRMASMSLLGAASPASAEDDDESHKKWEQNLCDILGQTEIYSGSYDCKIEFL